MLSEDHFPSIKRQTENIDGSSAKHALSVSLQMFISHPIRSYRILQDPKQDPIGS